MPFKKYFVNYHECLLGLFRRWFKYVLPATSLRTSTSLVIVHLRNSLNWISQVWYSSKELFQHLRWGKCRSVRSVWFPQLTKTIQEVWYNFFYFLTVAVNWTVNSTDLVEIEEVNLFLCRPWRRMWHWMSYSDHTRRKASHTLRGESETTVPARSTPQHPFDKHQKTS